MGPSELPLEIVEMIIASIPQDEETVAFEQSSSVTRTLFSCLTLCKATIARTQRLLYQRCLYIDSPERLRSLTNSYARSTSFGLTTDSKIKASTALYLEPFADHADWKPHDDAESYDDFEVPIVDERQAQTVGNDVQELFTVLSQSLARLVIKMPLRNLMPEGDNTLPISATLHHAFEQLKVIEEFTSTLDELYLNTSVVHDPPVWREWRFLRRLALYNVVADADFFQDLRQLPLLQTVVLTRLDRDEDSHLGDLAKTLQPTASVVLVNTYRDHFFTPAGPPSQDEVQILANRMNRAPEDSSDASVQYGALKVVCVGAFGVSAKGDDDIEICQTWIRDEALCGTLWETPNAIG